MLASQCLDRRIADKQILAHEVNAWQDPVSYTHLGGGTDYAARAVGVYLSRAFGQKVIVENKPGAGGLISIETAAKSPPDGYTALISADTLASAPAVTNLNTDYIKDLVPVIHLTSNPVILSVHSSLGVNSVEELIRAAKMQPGMGYATSGVGTDQHFTGEWFAQLAGRCV